MPTIGQRVGEYVLESKLGGGTFGEVWKAKHHVWEDQLVAIKIPTNPQYLRDLQREGAAIHGLVHPNIVKAIGFDPYVDPPYLTMEYVPGSNLRTLIASRSLRPDDSVAILRQVLAGLAHAHASNRVHRDIKPENILIHERAQSDGYNAEGVVKITDFGLGQAAQENLATMQFTNTLNTPEGRSIAGTLDYMAPEQRAGEAVDGRADLYACGVVLFEMLTGHRPHGIELPSESNPATPKYLDDVFRRSYVGVEKRYATAEAFMEALRSPGAGSAKLAALRPGAAGRCPRCNQPVGPDDQFCIHCGTQLVSIVRRCPKCHSYPDPSDGYCMHCGQPLAEATQLA